MQPAGDPHAPVRFDFGTIDAFTAGAIEHVFTLRNAGTAPISVERVQASCGCTSAVLQGAADAKTETAAHLPRTLAPGETVTVRAALNPRALSPGTQHKTVWIYTTGNAAPAVTLELNGVLPPVVRYSTDNLDFGHVHAGQPAEKTVNVSVDERLLQRRGEALTLVCSATDARVSPLDAGWEPSTDPTLAGWKTRKFKITLPAETPIGFLTGTLSLLSPPATTATAPTAPVPGSESLIPLEAEVIGTINASPAVLAFGIMPAGSKATRTIVLTGPTAAALTGATIMSSLPACVTTRFAPPTAGGSETGILYVTVAPGTMTGLIQADLNVAFKNGERLRLPVTAYVPASEAAASAKQK